VRAVLEPAGLLSPANPPTPHPPAPDPPTGDLPAPDLSTHNPSAPNRAPVTIMETANAD
jgi:hypothetical protein